MLLRSMNPQVIAMDEILAGGLPRGSLCRRMRVRVITTAHAAFPTLSAATYTDFFFGAGCFNNIVVIEIMPGVRSYRLETLQ